MPVKALKAIKWDTYSHFQLAVPVSILHAYPQVSRTQCFAALIARHYDRGRTLIGTINEETHFTRNSADFFLLPDQLTKKFGLQADEFVEFVVHATTDIRRIDTLFGQITEEITEAIFPERTIEDYDFSPS